MWHTRCPALHYLLPQQHCALINRPQSLTSSAGQHKGPHATMRSQHAASAMMPNPGFCFCCYFSGKAGSIAEHVTPRFPTSARACPAGTPPASVLTTQRPPGPHTWCKSPQQMFVFVDLLVCSDRCCTVAPRRWHLPPPAPRHQLRPKRTPPITIHRIAAAAFASMTASHM